MTDPKGIPFRAQSARDAAAAGHDVSYCLYLEQHAFELHGRFLAEQNWVLAGEMLSRPLADALRGNDGD